MRNALVLGVAALAACAGATAGEPAPVVCPLGWLGRADPALLCADGSVRSSELSWREWLSAPGAWEPASPQPGDAQYRWLQTGVRAVRTTSKTGDLELAATTGVCPYGRAAPVPWLFRTLVLTNRGPRSAEGRLCLSVAASLTVGPLAVRQDRDVVQAGLVRLVTSAVPQAARPSSDGAEVTLGFDYRLDARASLSVVAAAPLGEVRYDGAGWKELRELTPQRAEEALTTAWQALVVPETITIGDEVLNQAYHAALGGLLLDPPPSDAPAARMAGWVRSVARCRQGPAAARLVEDLLRRQQPDGALAPASADHVSLTDALCDYVLFSDAPSQWAAILWPAVSRAAAHLVARAADLPATASGGALRRAAEVARLAGHADSAGEWSRRAGGPVLPPLILGRAGPEAVWQARKTELQGQPLPGVWLDGGRADDGKAGELLAATADSVVRLDEGRVALLPALPLSWRKDEFVLELRQFPSGGGPLSLKLTCDRGGRRLTLASLALPKEAAAVVLYPPAGTQASAVRVDGKALRPDVFAKGPPWQIKPTAEKIVLDLK